MKNGSVKFTCFEAADGSSMYSSLQRNTLLTLWLVVFCEVLEQVSRASVLSGYGLQANFAVEGGWLLI